MAMMWKIVEVSKVSVIYIYIYIYIDDLFYCGDTGVSIVKPIESQT